MKIFKVLALALLYGFSLANSPQDYRDLNEFAHLTRISYCLKYGLSTGFLDKKDTGCCLEFCKLPEAADVEVVKTFNFNEWGGVGSGYVALDKVKQRILLVYRGTASRRDWKGNLEFTLVKYRPKMKSSKGLDCPDCKVHRGFASFLESHCSTFLDTVTDLANAYPDYKIIVLGHSLGGALAGLSAVELKLAGYDPLHVSFASPKVFNDKMSKVVDQLFNTKEVSEQIMSNQAFDTGYIRVTHKHDLVPYLPPNAISFKHAGFQYYINKKDLPHTPSDLERIGKDEPVEMQTAKTLRKLWTDSLGRQEHTTYFTRITDCKS